MTITVNGPNGITINFPDGTDEATINSAFSEATGQAAPAAKTDYLSKLSEITQQAGPQVSQGRAALEGALSGLSANWRDEIYGASEASGLPGILGGLRAPIGAARLGYENLIGTPGTATEAYQRARDEMRDVQKTAREQHPLTSLGTEIAASLALPGGALLNAPTRLARMGRGAAVGAGYGTLAGAGEGEGAAGMATHAATGLGLGALLGGAAPPLIEGAIGAGRLATAPFRGLRSGEQRLEDTAARQVAEAVETGQRADPRARYRMTEAEFARTPDAIVADLGGIPTQSLARSAANLSPEARIALNEPIDIRFETQSPRIVDWLNGNVNFANASDQAAALEVTARAVNKPAYAKAYREGAEGIWNRELERLAGSDTVAAAMQTAVRKAGDESIISGYGPMNPNITFTPDGRIQHHRNPAGMLVYPDLQYWDLVRRELTSMAKSAPRGSTEERRATIFAKQLNVQLDKAVSSYETARKGAHEFFEAENALEAGKNFVNLNKDLDDAMKAFNSMNRTEQRLFQDGFLTRFVEAIEGVRDRRSVLNDIAASTTARRKLNAVLGRRKADELEAELRVEGLMDLTRKELQGGPSTARQLAQQYGLSVASGLGGLGSAYLSGDPTHAAYGTGISLVALALANRKYKVNEAVAARVGRMLASDDPTVYHRGIQLLARDEKMMEALRAIDRAIIKTGSTQAGDIELQ